MVKVTLGSTVLAEAPETKKVEGNHYFPPDSVKLSLFESSSTSSVCPWKGTASYYNANIDGKIVKDIAWYYPSPNPKATDITGYVAFYKNKVAITE